MKLPLLLIFLFAICISKAQPIETTENQPQLAANYKELPNPTPTNVTLWSSVKKTQVGWGTIDKRYKKEIPAGHLSTSEKLNGWRGERLSAQFVVSNTGEPFELSVEVSDLKHTKSKNQKIAKNDIQVGFVRYVITDELNKDKKGTCGYRKSVDFDSTLVADMIDHTISKITIPTHSTRAVWLRIQLPQNIAPGLYQGKVTVKSNGKTMKNLPLQITVQNRTLPNAKQWAFHLDLWQNPYAVARYFNVTPWSDAHFERLKAEMKPYALAGGKSITASIMYQPWGGQTFDPFNSMVTWVKKADRTWWFDFTVFDKWVEFMHEMGVDKQINCYSMVPWKLSFQYFDQATNTLQSVETKPGETAYNQMWTAMLTAFAKHLKTKGWFDKTYISMDERPMKVMQQTLEIIKKADPNFKVSLAGALHDELEPDLDDYCVALRMKYHPETIAKRKKQGKVTTYYTSCEEPYPNTFTFSDPAESEWLAWYAKAANLDGYLRWALQSWTAEPLLDSRFVSWGAGDTYLLYPMGRSSIRFERLVQGIQFYEKVTHLKTEFIKTGNDVGVRQLDEALQLFNENTLPLHTANEVTAKARQIVNSL